MQCGPEPVCCASSCGAPDLLWCYLGIDESEELSAVRKEKEILWLFTSLKFASQTRPNMKLSSRCTPLDHFPGWSRDHQSYLVPPTAGWRCGTFVLLPTFEGLPLQSAHLPHRLFSMPPSRSLLPPQQSPENAIFPLATRAQPLSVTLNSKGTKRSAGLCVPPRGWKEDQRLQGERGGREFREQRWNDAHALQRSAGRSCQSLHCAQSASWQKEMFSKYNLKTF